MTSLQKPPEEDRPTRVVARILVLVILLLGVGLAVWTAVTGQRIELTETESLASIEGRDVTEAGGLDINVVEEVGGPVPVVFLHDADVAGGVLWDATVDRLGDRFKAVRVDLPGFGLSERVPDPGSGHTVASMAEVVSEVIAERFEIPVVAAGAGLGGEVAAEIAVTRPELVRGVVMIDVDFWSEQGWLHFFETAPWVGRAVVHTFEAGGRLGTDRWAPNCDDGGWCPTASQAEARELAASVENTTDSIKAFLETPASSLVPSDLDEIAAPVAYVWSTEGDVPASSVEMTEEPLSDLALYESDAWKVQLEDPATVAEAIEAVGG